MVCFNTPQIPSQIKPNEEPKPVKVNPLGICKKCGKSYMTAPQDGGCSC